MSRRRSRISSFFEGFEKGYELTNQVLRDFELNDVNKAKAEESQGFTADQGDQLRAAAESGQYDIGVKYKDDGGFDSYTVTPKADPTQTGTVAAQNVTDFMGNRTAGSMGKSEIADARQMARAEVYKKFGDEEKGSRLEQQIADRKRTATNDAWTEKSRARTEADWGRQDAELAKKDAYEKEKRSLFDMSNYADVERHNSQEQSRFQEAMRAYEEAAKRGDTSVAKPTEPQLRRYGAAESLQDQLAGLAFEAKHNKADIGKLGEVTQKMKLMEEEGYSRALEVALNGGNPQQISGAFNATGSMHVKPESLKVTTGEATVRGVKVPTTFVTFVDEKTGKTSTINTAAELAAYKGAKSLLDTQFAVNQDKRAANADGRAGAAANRAANDDAVARKDKTALRAANAELEAATQRGDPGAINAARIKVVEAGGKIGDGGGKDDPSDLQMARAALQARVPGVKDMATALQWARNSREKPMADVRADIYGKALTAKMGNAAEAKRETDAAMEYLFPQVVAEEQAARGGKPGADASKALTSVSEKAVGDARTYLGKASNQEEFNKRVQALRKQGWSDDQIRALAR